MRLMMILALLAGCLANEEDDEERCVSCEDHAIRCALSDAGAGAKIVTLPLDVDGGYLYCSEVCRELAPVNNQQLTLICKDLPMEDNLRVVECDYLLCA